ncbi:SDR family oxidoreductase [Streptomyces decoyicus]|uniref:SDR family oxidoreductase n=1 Tax=Streptomyces decoyicus TaxID=249567 RepID=A0ABZ1FAS0_9ACTN|nr:SDR family oxidoreductase [Streptomyces decoyicus]WSB67142.1 SDR family oxidoreductase [Streptomyces decoyicus]
MANEPEKLAMAIGMTSLGRLGQPEDFTLSNAAFYPGPGGDPLYAAAKHAGLGLVRQFAYELAPETRVNAVAPGLLETGISGGAMGLADASLSRDVPITQVSKNTALGIVVRPENVVGSYVLLAAEELVTTTGR